MSFHWETEDERLRRFMKISPKAKLEWLRQMSEFASRCLSPRSRQIRLRLRNQKETRPARCSGKGQDIGRVEEAMKKIKVKWQ